MSNHYKLRKIMNEPVSNTARFSKFLQHPVARARTVPSNQIAEGFKFGHVDFGVKWQVLPLCLKRKFYANHAFVRKGKILRQGCRCGHNDSILRH